MGLLKYVSVLDGASVVSGPMHTSFQSDASKNHPTSGSFNIDTVLNFRDSGNLARRSRNQKALQQALNRR